MLSRRTFFRKTGLAAAAGAGLTVLNAMFPEFGINRAQGQPVPSGLSPSAAVVSFTGARVAASGLASGTFRASGMVTESDGTTTTSYEAEADFRPSSGLVPSGLVPSGLVP